MCARRFSEARAQSGSSPRAAARTTGLRDRSLVKAATDIRFQDGAVADGGVRQVVEALELHPAADPAAVDAAAGADDRLFADRRLSLQHAPGVDDGVAPDL